MAPNIGPFVSPSVLYGLATYNIPKATSVIRIENMISYDRYRNGTCTSFPSRTGEPVFLTDHFCFQRPLFIQTTGHFLQQVHCTGHGGLL